MCHDGSKANDKNRLQFFTSEISISRVVAFETALFYWSRFLRTVLFVESMTAPPSCPPSSRRSRGGTASLKSCWGWAPPPRRWLTVSETCPWSCSGSAPCPACPTISRAGRPPKWAQSPSAGRWRTYPPNCSDWPGEAGWTDTCRPNSERWIPIVLHKEANQPSFDFPCTIPDFWIDIWLMYNMCTDTIGVSFLLTILSWQLKKGFLLIVFFFFLI